MPMSICRAAMVELPIGGSPVPVCDRWCGRAPVSPSGNQRTLRESALPARMAAGPDVLHER
jgi:hypothetical protein